MKSPNHFHDQSTYRFWLSADFPDCLPVYDGNDTRFISSSERKLFTCYSNNIAYFWFFGNESCVVSSIMVYPSRQTFHVILEICHYSYPNIRANHLNDPLYSHPYALLVVLILIGSTQQYRKDID